MGLVSFLPVFPQETIDRIRARLNADANGGLAPTDPAFIDTTPGGFFWDISQAIALEIERMWDAMGTEMPAAMFPGFAWGPFLDEHGRTIGLTRKPRIAATGTVTITGDPEKVIPVGMTVATPQVDPQVDPVEFAVTAAATIPSEGVVDVSVEASFAGPGGNVPAGQVTVNTSATEVAAVTNVAPITGGSDVESDARFRERILLAFAGAHGSGTISDYQSWALAYPGVGYVKVDPLWAGPGTVRVSITDSANNPVSATIVAGLQQLLDPVPAQGIGLAPIGAIVTVTTPQIVVITVAATVQTDVNYSLTGFAGTIAVQASIEEAVRDYIDNLRPGDSVVREHVIARFFDVPGVHDVIALTLNGSQANIALTADQVPTTGAITLS